MLRSFRPVPALLAALAIAGCGGSSIRGDGPGSARIPDLPDDPTPRHEARGKYGNGPVYEVFNKRYRVMPSSAGYRERGVASWYGKKFHGRLTSSREVYNMYAMTAAHKTLPLPTYVHVRNLQNDKTIVVRVNDRGPFVSNRIIDLSYAAALKLDMIRDGTGMVEVTAYPFDLPQGDQPTSLRTPPAPTTAAPVAEPVVHQIFVQVGAFGDPANAERRIALLASSGIESAFIHEEQASGAALYRVRIGPVADVVQYDVLVEELEGVGIMDPYLISE